MSFTSRPALRAVSSRKGRVEMEDEAMIEWGSPDWGGHVHYAENGSWVGDTHDTEKGKAKPKSKAKSKGGKDTPKSEQD